MLFYDLSQHLQAAHLPLCRSTEYAQMLTYAFPPHYTPSHFASHHLLCYVGTLTHSHHADIVVHWSDTASTCCPPASCRSTSYTQMRTFSFSTLHTPSHPLNSALHNLLLSVVTPTHPYHADHVIQWSITASTSCSPASLYKYRICTNACVNIFYNLPPLIPPELCLTPFVMLCGHSHTPSSCWYRGTLLWHSIYMLPTWCLAEVQNTHKWVRSHIPLSTFPRTPWTLPNTMCYVLWALPHTLIKLILWYFDLTQHLYATHMLPCRSTEYAQMRTFSFSTLHTPSHPLNSALHNLLLSVVTPTHPYHADHVILWSITASTSCSPASLQKYRICTNAYIRISPTLHPLTLCLTPFVMLCGHSYTLSSCWYCGTLIRHSINMLPTCLLQKYIIYTNAYVLIFYTPHPLTPPELCFAQFVTFCGNSHTPISCWSCYSMIYHSIYKLLTCLLVQVQNMH